MPPTSLVPLLFLSRFISLFDVVSCASDDSTTEKLLRRLDHAFTLALILFWIAHEYLKQRICQIVLHSDKWFTAALVVRVIYWPMLILGFGGVIGVGLSGIGEMQVSTGVLTAALLGAILSQRMPNYRDKRAAMIRQLLGTEKLHFGNPGKKHSPKFVITNKLRYKGGNIWDDVSAAGFEQALPDWGIEHRISNDDVLMVEEQMMKGRPIDMAVIGRMLRKWLPTGVCNKFNFSTYFSDNGDLKGAYHGSRGQGIRKDGLSFEDWKQTEAVTTGLELWAREYEDATGYLIDALKDIVVEATDSDDLGRLFGERLAKETRKEQKRRYPNTPGDWSELYSTTGNVVSIA